MDGQTLGKAPQQLRQTCENGLSYKLANGGTGGLLIVGGKGVGKSSLLQAARRELVNEKMILSAILFLDNTMVVPGKEHVFFQSILAEFATAASKASFIETGLATRIVEALQRHVKIEELKAELPFISLAASVGSETPGERFPSMYFRDGLKEFQQKVGKDRGIILFLDDGDYLTQNPALLQILKNVFQDTPRAGIIIAGTTDLLITVSKLFSPLLRFLERKDLGPYDSVESLGQAVDIPLRLTQKNIAASRKIGVVLEPSDYGGATLMATLDRVSGRMPLEVNLLCHYALESGANRALQAGPMTRIPMRIDHAVIQKAMNQLIGTVEYGQLIDQLDEKEQSFLKVLGQADSKVTLDELTVLLYLDEMGGQLQSIPIDRLCTKLGEFSKHKVEVQRLYESVSKKSEALSIHALSQTIIGRSGLSIEDQWLRAYFKFSVAKIWYDLDNSSKIPIEGLRFYGDPITTILHSVLFPRLGRAIYGHAEYRAHTHRYGVELLQIEQGRKLVFCLYRRAADGREYHLAYQIRSNEDSAECIVSIDLLLDTLQSEGIVSSYTPARERRR